MDPYGNQYIYNTNTSPYYINTGSSTLYPAVQYYPVGGGGYGYDIQLTPPVPEPAKATPLDWLDEKINRVCSIVDKVAA
jgi:hypothetical protein